MKRQSKSGTWTNCLPEDRVLLLYHWLHQIQQEIKFCFRHAMEARKQFLLISIASTQLGKQFSVRTVAIAFFQPRSNPCSLFISLSSSLSSSNIKYAAAQIAIALNCSLSSISTKNKTEYVNNSNVN